ncbi:hypothetical protein SDC9_63431 [bioreactor metagenome]|uniref:Uncharacterized protein n=1 Tax=bioreactor metagenome TaxID=1076179 RepID=A0A644XMQ4_9ZZZZ
MAVPTQDNTAHRVIAPASEASLRGKSGCAAAQGATAVVPLAHGLEGFVQKAITRIP